MLGDFITRCLLYAADDLCVSLLSNSLPAMGRMVFGYAYPAFQCFKTVEKNRVEIEELRFWCQYWIIVAMVTVLERIMDILISWLPMYSELKLAFILYLWHPKTMGTVYIYENLLRPFVAQHENDIDRKLKEWRARAWDLAIFCWQNCAVLGQTAFVQLLQSLASRSGKFSESANEDSSNQKRSPSPSTSINRAMSESPKFEDVQVHQTSGQAEFVYVEEETTPKSKLRSPVAAVAGDSQSDEKSDSPCLRLRRSKPEPNANSQTT
ncbi:hypothetical protein CDL15_Pgr002143 [Punica granatum]|uniref:HVA22-like protein n=1 Tax=Punica granatum TaxID=22663 RepID=A0A218XCP5_PUNGR|nr:hypothetical protein CDL15_Pgr002143 [Punica granatum]